MKYLLIVIALFSLSKDSHASIDILFKAKDEIATKALLLDSVLELSEELEYSTEQVKKLLEVKRELEGLNEDINNIEYLHSEAVEFGAWNDTRDAELSYKISTLTAKIRAAKRLYKTVIAMTSMGSVDGGILAETKHSNYYLRDISKSLSEQEAGRIRSDLSKRKREKEDLNHRSAAMKELSQSIKKHQKKSGFGF